MATLTETFFKALEQPVPQSKRTKAIDDGTPLAEQFRQVIGGDTPATEPPETFEQKADRLNREQMAKLFGKQSPDMINATNGYVDFVRGGGLSHQPPKLSEADLVDIWRRANLPQVEKH